MRRLPAARVSLHRGGGRPDTQRCVCTSSSTTPRLRTQNGPVFLTETAGRENLKSGLNFTCSVQHKHHLKAVGPNESGGVEQPQILGTSRKSVFFLIFFFYDEIVDNSTSSYLRTSGTYHEPRVQYDAEGQVES